MRKYGPECHLEKPQMDRFVEHHRRYFCKDGLRRRSINRSDQRIKFYRGEVKAYEKKIRPARRRYQLSFKMQPAGGDFFNVTRDQAKRREGLYLPGVEFIFRLCCLNGARAGFRLPVLNCAASQA